MNVPTDIVDTPPKPRNWLILAIVASILLALILKMGFFFLLIGMLPTLAVMTLVRRRGGYIISTIAAFNFAGLFPDLLSIYMQGGAMRAFLEKLSEISVWVSMYGAALLGMAIVWLSPSIASLFLEGVYRGRLSHLKHVQKRLEEEWGPQIKERKE